MVNDIICVCVFLEFRDFFRFEKNNNFFPRNNKLQSVNDTGIQDYKNHICVLEINKQENVQHLRFF